MIELLIAAGIATAPVDQTAIQEFKEQNIVQIEPEVTEPTEKLYTIKENENLTKIAEQHETTWQRIYDKNLNIDNPDLVEVGTEIVIPEADESLETRPLPVVQVSTHISRENTPQPIRNSSNKATASSSWFPRGQCTWWVASKRAVGAWNNASDWLWQARRDGYATGSQARPGAIAWRYGHVAFVESVSGSSMTISEANYDYRGSVRTITIPVSSYSAFIY